MLVYQNKSYTILLISNLRKILKLTKRDMAYHLGIDVATLYNWRKNKPNLYRIVMLGFKFDDAIRKSKENYENLLQADESIKSEMGNKKST